MCKVFSASNVTFVTRARLEHLSNAEKERAKEGLICGGEREFVLGLMGFYEMDDAIQN